MPCLKVLHTTICQGNIFNVMNEKVSMANVGAETVKCVHIIICQVAFELIHLQKLRLSPSSFISALDKATNRKKLFMGVRQLSVSACMIYSMCNRSQLSIFPLLLFTSFYHSNFLSPN